VNLRKDQQNQMGRQQFHERICGLEVEMKKIETSLHEFLQTVTVDFKGLVDKIVLMRENMQQIKREGIRTTNEL